MSLLSRRDMLALLTLSWASGFSTSGHAHAPMNSGLAWGATRQGLLHALGMNPDLFPKIAERSLDGASILSTIDLATGQSRQTLLPMAGGHATESLGNGNVLCIAHHKPKSLIVTADHSILAELIADPGHVFGGHAWIDLERQIFLLPQKRAKAERLTDTGSIVVYDTRTFHKLDQVDTGGIHPHEIHTIPGTGEIAVTHYGDVTARHAVLAHHVVDPKLTILDGRTFRPKRHYQQSDFNAMVTHMRVGPDGWAHVVLTQYVSWPLAKAEDSFQTALRNLESTIGRKTDFAFPQASLDERLLPLPLPVLAINTQTGERRIVNAGDRYHLRSQSVAHSAATGLTVAVYSHSDNLILERNGRLAGIVSAAELGLRNLRGVAEVSGSPCIAVMGAYRGAVIYDLDARSVVARYETENFLDTHLQYAGT